MSDESVGWRSIGDHSYRVEPPDLVFVRDRGDILPEHVAPVIEELQQMVGRGIPPLWLVDITELGEVHPETRKCFAQSDLMSILGPVAVIGASFSRRVLMRLVFNAAKLARPGAKGPDVRFFASEAEARAWLDEVRRSRLSRSSPGSLEGP